MEHKKCSPWPLRLRQRSNKFIAYSLKGDVLDFGRLRGDCVGCTLVEGKAQSASEAHGTQHSEVIFGKAPCRTAYCSYDLAGYVSKSITEVQVCFRYRVIEYGVNCEVAASSITSGIGEA